MMLSPADRERMMRAVGAVGKAVDGRWDAVNRDVRLFAPIAREALQEAKLHETIRLQDLISLALEGDLPVQTRRAFGQPPLNLYVTDDFLLEANFWVDGTTTIHDHRFQGAFQMLHGRSLHTRYAYREEERLNEAASLGQLLEESAEILVPGIVSEIVSGMSFIHSAFHLDRPSVSIVLRTTGDAEAAPQKDFHLPGMAASPNALHEPMRTQLDLMRVLGIMDPARMCRELASWCVSRGKLAAIEALRLGAECAPNTTELTELRSAVHAKFPGVLCVVDACSAEQQRRGWIVSQRTRLKDEKVRFFMAMLLVKSRETRSRLIAHENPGLSYAHYVIESTRDLARHGVKTEARDELSIAILEELLTQADRESLVARLEVRFPGLEFEKQSTSILERAGAIAGDPLFFELVDEHWRGQA